jgi:hypothetical protein
MTMRTKSWGAWVVAAAVFAPAALWGQSTSEAARLEADALSLSESPSDLGKAADLFRQASALRPAGDPTAIKDLIQAARFSFYAGKRDRALKDFAAAAETALRFGDVLAAAESFLDAAWVAQQVSDGAQALRYAGRARELSASPMLREDDRARLLSRLPG